VVTIFVSLARYLYEQIVHSGGRGVVTISFAVIRFTG
jgi:hypothetical protein